jgi:hypothetical protein
LRRIARAGRGGDSDVMRASDLVTRIDEMCSRASDARSGERLLTEMEALLAEGYAEALASGAGSRRLAQRLERLVESVDQAGAAVELRRTVLEKRRLDDEVAVLRGRLSVMREEFARLRARARSG